MTHSQHKLDIHANPGLELGVAWLAVAVLLAGFAAGCQPQTATEPQATTESQAATESQADTERAAATEPPATADPQAAREPQATSEPQTDADVSDDPHAFCREVGTLDDPAPDQVSPAMDTRVAEELQAALELPEPLPRRSYAWRCMDGELWGCFVGANLNCGKANAETRPTVAMVEYCSNNPGSDFIPMFITGHDTVWEWKCDGPEPITGRQLSDVDERGYQASNWYRLGDDGGG